MKSWRGVPVLVSVLSGMVVGCGPVPEGGVEDEAALESEAVIETVTAAVAKEPAGLMAHRWEVCDDVAERVRDINPGPAGSQPQGLVHSNGRLFFSAQAQGSGRELWMTSGEGRHTTLVKDVRPGASSSSPRELMPVGPWVFFVADDGEHGPELWRTDGTERGTVLVRDVQPGRSGSAPEALTAVGDLLYFTADDGEHGRELWRSDGTERGTVLVRDFTPEEGMSSSPSGLTAWEGGLALVASTRTENTLWFIDKRQRVSKLFTTSLMERIFKLTATARQLFFLHDAGTGEGTLWAARNSPRSATRLRHFPGDYPAWFTVMEDVVYFQAGAEGFFGEPGDPLHGGELWRSDGTPWGTRLVRDIQPGSGSSLPTDLVAVEGVLYFAADDGEHGRELWRSDGTSWGTWLVKDLEPGPGGSDPAVLTGEKEWVFFAASTTAHGHEVWYSNGRPWDTKPLMNTAQSAASVTQLRFVQSGWDVFFPATDSRGDQELYAVPFRPTRYCGRR